LEPCLVGLGDAREERYERPMRAWWVTCAVLVACGTAESDPTLAGGGAAGGSGGAGAGGGAGGGGSGGSPGECPHYADGASRGLVAGDGLVELSGVVASRAHSGVLWAHNDSGDEARVFALRAADAAHLGTYAVVGATARDWEAIAIGPHGGADAIFIGDIGDNERVRAAIDVYVVPEPAVSAEQSFTAADAPGAITVTLGYPEGAENAEALLVDPASGDLYLLTKSDTGVSDVYRKAAPHVADEVAVLERVATLLPRPGDPHVTAADISPDGARILVRSYDRAFLYLRAAGSSVAAALAAAPCDVPHADEVQGEAIAFAADGSGYFSVSENPDADPDSPQPLWLFAAE
jgi:hypothetical protein